MRDMAHDLRLVWRSLCARRLNSFLSIMLTAFAVMLAVLILQFSDHVQKRLYTDSRNIDFVIGAKGSPLQLILSTIYHVDIPTGNIPFESVYRWQNHPQIQAAIPLALGDQWRGHRIVGTTYDYMRHYRAELAQGRVWQDDFEAVAGAQTGLDVGQEIAGSHGLRFHAHNHDHDGHEHGESPYKIVGVLQSTGTILDRLILTSVDSVLKIHGIEGLGDEKAEITALLMVARTPIAAINLPRQINRETAYQAAVPAIELTRLTRVLGLGTQTVAILAVILVVVAGLSLFAGLAGALENRSADLAVLRAMGYGRARLFFITMAEGLCIASVGLIIGMAGGLALFSYMAHEIAVLAQSGAMINIDSKMAVLATIVLVAGILASLIPARRAANIDVAQQLSRRGA